jgi:exodeoxyribonuclease VII large subunit
MTGAQPPETRRSINEVNSLIRALVEQETLGYPFWVRGIVSRRFQSDFGHIYFDLTDEDYSINCFLAERRRGHIEFELANGLEIEVFGSIRVYDRQAKVQIDVEQARLIAHDPFVLDQPVQAQLAQQGCWPPPRRPLPEHIQRIGLITSRQSDAMRDFEDTYREHSGSGAAPVELADVRLQGVQAPAQIAQAIQRLNREKRVSVIVLTRGGGRKEDLAVFNDLSIAQAICQSDIPIVTGIGHQRDDTLADQMADFKAITPTAAAIELARHTPAAVPAVAPQSRSDLQVLIIGAAIVIAAIVFALLILAQST